MADQYFTSAELADHLVSEILRSLSCTCKHHRFLDPCAGNGSLVAAAHRVNAHCDGIEIDEELCKEHGWAHGDFLEAEQPERPYCAVLCNPPFSGHRIGNQERGIKMQQRFMRKMSSFSKLYGLILYCNQSLSLENMKSTGIKVQRVVDVSEKEKLFAVNNGEEQKRVSVCIFVAKKCEPERPVYVTSTRDFDLLTLNDDRANLLVKRWDKKRTLLQVFIQNPAEIGVHVGKKRKFYGRGYDPWLHLLCVDPHLVRSKIEGNVDIIEKRVRHCDEKGGICITPTVFCKIYEEILQRSV